MAASSPSPIEAGRVTLDTAIERLHRGGRSRRRRYLLATGAMALVLVTLWWIMILYGGTTYSMADAIAVMRGETVAGASFTIGTLRLPRAITAVLAGFSFGMAGVVFQTMLRNPLASPDILGITKGASAAAIFGILVLGWSGSRLSILAVAAGLAAAGLIYLLASGRGILGGRFILIGIGVSAMFDAVISYLLLRGRTWDIPAAMRWLSGSLNGSRWNEIPVLLASVVILGAILLSLHRRLGLLSLGDPTATALGIRVDRTRIVLIMSAVALAAIATAVAGPIAFVAFLSGPIATRISGGGGPAVVPSALIGAILVLTGDLMGQFAFDTRFPVGVITGIIGAPYLVLLLIRFNRSGGSA